MVYVAVVLYGTFFFVALELAVALIPGPRHTVQVTMPQNLPPRLQTLADHGMKVYVVKRRPPLPRRVPGASLVTNSPDDVRVEHVTSLPKPYLRRTASALRRRVERAVGSWILGTPRAFADDWASGWHRDLSGYVPQHSRSHPTVGMRHYWADWPTQWWPTLATEGDWHSVQQRSLLTRCHGVPAVLTIRTIAVLACTSEPPVYGIEGVFDAHHIGGARPGREVDDRRTARHAARESLPAHG